MYVQSHTSNTSPARPFLVLLLSLMVVPGWISQQVGFVDAGMNKPFSMFVFSILTPRTVINHFPPVSYRAHENVKKRTYEQCIREIEHGTFTPLVLSFTRGMEAAATVCYNRLASMIAQKRDKAYSRTMSWLRCSLSFSFLSSAHLSNTYEALAQQEDGLPGNLCHRWTCDLGGTFC